MPQQSDKAILLHNFQIPLFASLILIILGVHEERWARDNVEEYTCIIREHKLALKASIYQRIWQEDYETTCCHDQVTDILGLIKEYSVECFISLPFFLFVSLPWSYQSLCEILQCRKELKNNPSARPLVADRRVSSPIERLEYGLYLAVKEIENQNMDISPQLLTQCLSREVVRYKFYQKNNFHSIDAVNALQEGIDFIQSLKDFDNLSLEENIKRTSEYIEDNFEVEMLERRTQIFV